jgi:hypothetical protein
MHRLLFLLAPCFLAGCLHMYGIAGGATNDDFYLIVNRGWGKQCIVHCERTGADPVACTKVLGADQAAGYAAVPYDDWYFTCAEQAEYDATWDEPDVEAAVSDGPATDEERRGCREGYAEGLREHTSVELGRQPTPPTPAPAAELPAPRESMRRPLAATPTFDVFPWANTAVLAVRLPLRS